MTATDPDPDLAEARRLAAIAGPRPEELPSPREPRRVADVLLVRQFRQEGHPTLRRWRGTYWTWHGSRWVETEDQAMRKVVYDFTENATYIDTKGKAQPWAPTTRKVTDVLDAAAAASHLDATVHAPAWLRRPTGAHPARELVACENGLLHVGTRDLGDHDPRLLNLTSVPFAFDAHAPAPRRWLDFLTELWPDDPDSIAALQEYAGYIISGRTDLQKILLMVGPTRAGKGVIARVLKNLVGDGNYAGPTLASLGTNFGLSPLIGKPLAIISDARLGGASTAQVVERLLSVSGEDTLDIDRKYREPWTGTLPTRFLIISNELPRFGDASGAIANRFVVLVLRHSVLGRENPNLTNELLPELPGILNWALDGLARIQAAGRFSEPAASRDSILALQDLVSPVAAFVRDRCKPEPGAETLVKHVYDEWKVWAEDNGHRATTAQTFGRDLRAAVPGLRITRPRTDDDRRDRWYQGLALVQTNNGPDRGPLRTTTPDAPLVHDGPQSNPLLTHTGTCVACGEPCPAWMTCHPTCPVPS